MINVLLDHFASHLFVFASNHNDILFDFLNNTKAACQLTGYDLDIITFGDSNRRYNVFTLLIVLELLNYVRIF